VQKKAYKVQPPRMAQPASQFQAAEQVASIPPAQSFQPPQPKGSLLGSLHDLPGELRTIENTKQNRGPSKYNDSAHNNSYSQPRSQSQGRSSFQDRGQQNNRGYKNNRNPQQNRDQPNSKGFQGNRGQQQSQGFQERRNNHGNKNFNNGRDGGHYEEPKQFQRVYVGKDDKFMIQEGGHQQNSVRQERRFSHSQGQSDSLRQPQRMNVQNNFTKKRYQKEQEKLKEHRRAVSKW